MLASMRELAQAKIDDLRERFDEIRNELRLPMPHGLDLPKIVVPEPEIDATLHGLPLVSSQWAWEEMTAALKRHKSYGDPSNVSETKDNKLADGILAGLKKRKPAG